MASQFQFKNLNFSFIIFAIFFISFAGVFFLNGIKYPGGQVYLNLILAFTVVFMILLLFVKEEDRSNKILIPIHKTETESAFYLIFGIVSVVVLLGIMSFLSPSTSSIFFSSFQPFAINANTITGITNFSALEASVSSGWTAFVISFTAGVQEEIMIGFFSVAISIIISILLFKKFLKIQNDYIVDIFGFFVFPMLIFAFIHFTNGNYVNNPGLFIYAMIFRLIMNTFIYIFKWGIAFTIGAHGAINAFALNSVFIEGLFSWQGLIIIGVIAVCVIFIVGNWKEVQKISNNLFSNVGWIN